MRDYIPLRLRGSRPPAPPLDMLRILRKGLLFYLLVLVAGGHWLTVQRTTSWDDTLWVVVHPINGDGSARAANYIANLEADSFASISDFMAEEAGHHGVSLRQPFRLVLGQEIADQPPMPPADGGALAIMLWSLKLRYWAWRVDRGPEPPPSDIDIFVRYFDPDEHRQLAHSLGLQKGLIGVVNAFASRTQSATNHVVIAHELLHTVGASDKYDRNTAQPIYPHGYAEPDADPRFPQDLGELMGGRIPVSAHASRIPRSLHEMVVGEATAREIRWRP